MTPAIARDRDDIERALRAEGGEPQWWSNGPGDEYSWHSHRFHKVLFCVSGSIVFHTRAGEIMMEAGDRLDLSPNTEHAATVGPSGVECAEVARNG